MTAIRNPRPLASTPLLPIAALLFTITGATALLAEQIFEKLLGTLLGTSTLSAAVVLAVYFGGLTIGGWSYRFWARTRIAPIRLYAFFEIAVGSWAILLYLAFESLIPFFVPLLRTADDSLATLQFLRGLVAACWILPPTIFMGSTFPAIADVLSANAAHPRKAIAFFYSLNLLGAVFGAAAGPYLVFPAAGLDGCLLVAALADLAVGTVALSVSRRLNFAGIDAGERNEESIAAPKSYARGVLIAAAGVSGLLFFSLEIVWTQLISVVAGNSVYAFALMLTMVLLGLFLGGVAASAVFPGNAALPAAVVAGFLVAGSLLLALQQALWPHVPHLFTMYGSGIHDFAHGELLRAAVTAILLVPVAAVLGVVFPLLFRLEEFPVQNAGRVAGAMTAANAAGCLAGSVLAAFVLIPQAGSEATLLISILVYAALGMAVAFLSKSRRVRASIAVAGGIAIAVCAALPPWDRLAITSGEHVYFRPMHVRPETRLLFFHEDAAGGMTTVIANPNRSGGWSKILLTNGKFQGSDGAETAAQTGVVLAPSLHVRAFGDALVIGLGTGQTAHVVDQTGFRSIDIAEIAPDIVEAARTEFAKLNGGVVDRPNVRVFLEDGRNVMLLRDKSYDLITLELTSIWFTNATNLYSREFYELASKRLRPGGVFQQWVQIHHIGPTELLSTIETVRGVFPYVSVWMIGGQGVIVASKEEQRATPAGIEHCIGFFRRSGNADPQQQVRTLLDQRLLYPNEVTQISQRFPVTENTDRNRFIEYSTPRYNLSRADYLALNPRFLVSLARAAGGRPPR